MIILTGGAGFVGSNLLTALNDRGFDDVLVVDNLRNSDKYRNLVGKRFRDYISKEDFLNAIRSRAFTGPVDAIFHEGACTDTMEYDGEYMLANNFTYSKELLHFALDRRVPFIYASSAAVYGHTEVAREDDADASPLNVYGYSKLLFDQYVRIHAQGAESTVVGLRYFNVYGNGEQHKGRMSSMVFQLNNQVRESGVAKLFGAIGSFGPGEQRRDFVYVKDIVAINLFFFERAPIQTIVNAGSGQARTWNELGRAVIDTLGTGRIEYVTFPEGLKDKYQFNTKADLTKLRSVGFALPLHSLEDGVRDYLTTMDSVTARFRSGI